MCSETWFSKHQDEGPKIYPGGDLGCTPFGSPKMLPALRGNYILRITMAIMRSVPTRYSHLRSALESWCFHIKENGIPILTGNAEASKRLQNSKVTSLKDSL